MYNDTATNILHVLMLVYEICIFYTISVLCLCDYAKLKHYLWWLPFCVTIGKVPYLTYLCVLTSSHCLAGY